ncbi:hypothetical protein J4714_12990 [Staphylococcus epidermidis]|nr:hypothetical protein [Staphylococcus epidermidis]
MSGFIFDRAIDVFGNAALSIYLAIALLSLKLWELTDLAGPLMVILAAQTIVMALYAAFITFRIMGKNMTQPCWLLATAALAWVPHHSRRQYAGHYQPVRPFAQAFLIVPLVGAFFIDIINAFLLQAMISLIR